MIDDTRRLEAESPGALRQVAVVKLTSEAHSRPVRAPHYLCLGRELMHEWESTSAVTGGIGGALPATVVSDGDGDLAVGDNRVQPNKPWCRVPGEGMLGGVSESFIHCKGKVLSRVLCEETVNPAAERPAQSGGVLRGRNHSHVQLRHG